MCFENLYKIEFLENSNSSINVIQMFNETEIFSKIVIIIGSFRTFLKMYIQLKVIVIMTVIGIIWFFKD